MPAYLDYYLAKTGFDGQQTDQPVSVNRKNNLYKPLPGDHGARGPFDNTAANASIETWMATHRKATLGAVAAMAAGIFAIALLNK